MIVLLGSMLATGLLALAPLLAGATDRVTGGASHDLLLRELVVSAAAVVAALAAVLATVGAIATAMSASGLCSRSRLVAGCVRLTPAMVRRIVLFGCGAALTLPVMSGVAQASVAGPDRPPGTSRTDADLSGLALPDLPTAPRSSRSPIPRAAVHVRVEPGDSLWSIASDLLGADATAAQIVLLVDALHHRNVHQIGADPDLILPGTELTLRRNR